MTTTNTTRLLGYPPDARLLIVNADDFGMCHSVNAAVIGALQEGIVRSTTLMVTCPWMLEGLHFLADHPEIPFGVHLTVISDWVNYRWGPVTPRDQVPSLIDKAGYFYNFEGMGELFSRVNLAELEMEFRAQIEIVLAAGLKPTHLDWHCLRLNGREEISEVMLGLAREYGLAFRVNDRPWIAKVQSRGFPTNDHDILDSYQIDLSNKAARYAELLRELPVGLSEWAVHPGFDNAELLAIDPTGKHKRQTDYDFLVSREAKDIVKEEGIILLDYRALQDVWREM